ncbi:HMA2 domain-containing protein [Mailhella sp.]|uniref:HMA2 domain-containing protein n=1 Tax=Mailhella sp. TaxID=1981029 RepID=UPI003AB4EDA6
MVSISDCVTSFIDGRVRFRHPALKHAETAAAVSAVVGGVEGVTEASVNPVTGSLLVRYDAETISRDKLLELARQGLALLPDMPSRVNSERCLPSCLRAALSPKVTRLVDRALLVSLLCCLAGAATGMGALHRVAGAAFAVAGLQHAVAHRKALWR